MACIRRYNGPVYIMCTERYPEVYVQGLCNYQYTSVSLYWCILSCGDYLIPSVREPYMSGHSKFKSFVILYHKWRKRKPPLLKIVLLWKIIPRDNEWVLRTDPLREKPNIRARIRSNTDRRTPRMPQCSDVFDYGWLEIHLEYSIGIPPVFPYSNLILVNDSKSSINHTRHVLVD